MAADPRHSIETIAARLDVSPNTVRAEIQGGRLQAHRIGTGKGIYRISEQQFQDYLELTTTHSENNGASEWLENSKAESGKPTFRTKDEVSNALGATLTPKKTRKRMKRPSAAKPLITSLGAENDVYSGRH